MNCSSEPGGIAAGAGALPGARRRREAGKRTPGPGPRACLALLAATALLALAAPAQAQTEIWSATFTPADVGSGVLGCSNGVSTGRCSSTSLLSEDSFNYDSTDYNITVLFLRPDGRFQFQVDAAITTATAALTLVVGSTALVLANATIVPEARIWNSSGVSLTVGTAITVKLTAPGTPNTAAMGAPTITGTAQVGKMLTAVTTGITDADGLTSATYTYQWIRVDGTDEEDISGENSSTYTLVDADLGKTIKVKVSFTDDASNAETLTSAATVTVAADTTPPEVESVRVPISGSQVELVFDEDLDETVAGNLNDSVFSLTVAGQAVTIADYDFQEATLFLYVQTGTIKQGQTVVVSYTDPTTGDDTVALQDSAGNDVASFTTGMSGVPAVTNDSTVATTNTAPTAANKTVTTGEDRPYTFEADDFGFMDADTGAALASVKIVTVPLLGTLALDGTAVLADGVVTEAQIDADMLTFTPAQDAHGAPYTTFTFKVNDGTVDSADAYTMTIDVTDAPPPVCAVPDIAGDGRRQIWTGTVMVEALGSLGNIFGYGFTGAGTLGGSLADDTFSIGSNGYTVDALYVYTVDHSSSPSELLFSLTGTSASGNLTMAETEVLQLHVCDSGLDLFGGGGVFYFGVFNSYLWDANLDWSDPVVTRTVYLSLPANNDATGEPTISGTARAEQVLTADASPIMDTDGLPSSFTYKWFRVDSDGTSNEEDITGETAATYTLTTADVGKKVKVKVSFTDQLSGEEERTSAAYPSSGTVTVAGPNTAPTAANNTVTTGEDRPYAFDAGDFGFDDADAGDTLASVTIVTVPSAGTLALDGTAVLADGVVTEAQIDADMLTFTPAQDAHGAPYTTFTFKVNDGTVDSADAYTMTIDVTDAPLPVCAMPSYGDRRQIWTGTMTVEEFSFMGSVSGYGFQSSTGISSLLPSAEFSIGSNSYTIVGLSVGLDSGDLLFSVPINSQLMTATERAALRLNVCDEDLDFSVALSSTDSSIYGWVTSFDWSDPVVTRTVYLSLPANNPATGEPAITGTAQAGQALTAVTTGILDTDGLTDVDFTYRWLRVDADGTSNPVDITDANAATYSLTAADAGKKIKVQVSFTDELSGEEERTSAAYPSSGTVTAASTTAPALTSVTVTSTPHKTTDTYGAREHIEFSMTFDAPVTVTGDPTFAFDLGGASTASYYAGSGTATLRFSHAVSGGTSGDQDTNGISWAMNAIALNGGTIAGTDNAVTAILTHAAQSNLAAHKVDGRTTAVTAATVTDVVVTSTPMLMASGSSTADTYGFGETIVITVTVSEAVEVEGDPVFRFSLTNPGSAANNPQATYDRTRSIATTIVFTYTVQAGDRDTNGIWIGTHNQTFSLDANDRIRTASQQIDIDRSHLEKGTQGGHKVDGSLGAPTVPPDPTAPTLVSATATTLTIEWTHPGDGGSPLTRNFIEYRVEGTTDWTNWYRGETPTQVTRTVITNLAAATAYDVRVHATNAIGNSSWTQSATAFSTLAGTAATGAPTITGTAAVGQPLAVDLTGIADADGLTNVSYSYQWVRVDADGLSNEVDIADATDATYTLVDADLGKTLKVRVTFDDDAGNTETLTSAATATVTPAAGAPDSPTDLSALVGVGQVVLVWQHSQGVGGDRSSYEYRSSAGDMIAPDAMWQQVQTSAGEPNQAYYQVVKGLTNGTTHTFQVRAENPQGGSAPATVTATPLSQPSCIIDALGDRRLLWQGQLTAGIREISTDGNIETGYGGGGVETGTLTTDAFTFRSTTYSVTTWTSEDRLYVTLRDSDLTAWYPRDEVVDALRLHVCNTPYGFSDATASGLFSEYSGYRWNVDSNWPPGIERTLRLSLPPNHPATGDPVISGTVQVDEELTAVTTGIMDDDGLDDVFTYQWVRLDADGTSNEENITDETDATYTLTAAEQGKKVKVEVRFVDILGGEETRTSAPTATLAGAPNTRATGAPTITGTAQVGETLTAVTTGIMDANGLTSPTYTYQWIRVDGTDEADIAAANSSTYILGDADLGKTLKVRVTFADDLGHTETLTSAATATVGAVATGPPTVNDVAVTSTPASGTTYYLADEVIEFTVTFSAPVTVTATPKFAFRLGAATRQAAYESGSDSVALVFARTVQAGEVDRNGISWNAIALALDGGTITQTGATTAASLTHAEQANLEGHRVDAAPPMQVSASVQGLALVLVYDEPLDPASMPATGAYTVTATVGATTTNPAVSEVSIYGIWVTLTLDAAPAVGATVTLAYAPPASNPVQDEAGNDAPAFSGQSVRLGPPPPTPDLAQVLGVGVAPGNAQLVVTWTAVDNATGYTVQWTSGGQGYNSGDRQATVTSGSTTSHTITGLANGTEYTVQVSATRTGANDGPPSDEMTGTPFTTPPPPPPDLAQVMGVTVVPGNAQLVVTWTAVDTATGYTVQWKSGGQGYNTGDRQATVTSGTTTSHTITGLANGTEYTVQVSATRTGANDGPPSDEMTGTPTVPTAAGIAVSTAALTVTEQDSTGDGYTVVLDTEPTADVVVTVAGHVGTDVTANPTTLTFTMSNWETAQTVTVTADDDADTTDDSVALTHSAASADSGYNGIAIAGVAVTVHDNDTAQVLGVGVVPGNAQLVVTWTAVDNATGYTVQWKSGSQGYNTTNRQATVTTGSTTSHTITGLANGTEYTVQVSATRTGANDGPPSDEMTGTPFTTPPPPPPVTNLAQVLGVSVTPGNAQLVVTWTAVDNATGYTVQWKSGGQGYNTGDRQATVTTGSTTSHTITGLANGTEYTVQVSATRTGANDGPPSDEMTGTPTAPTAAGIAVSTAALTVTEQDSTGDGYTVVLDTEPTADVVVTVAGHVGSDVTANPTALTFTMSNWETAQTVTVTADDDADTTDDSVALTHSAASADSGYSGIAIAGVAVTVNDNDTAQVTGVGVAPGNAQLVVTWTAVDNATGYTVQWKSGGQGYNTGDRQATVTSGSTTSHTITGLANGTEYTVQVSATRTGANDGPSSSEVMGTPFTTPPPPPPVTDLEQVLGVSVTPGNAQLVVTWTAVSTATGYTVQWTSSGQGYNSGDRQATVTSGSTTSHTITGLANGTAYTVRVIATRTGANDGPPSSEVTASPVTTPGAPQHLSAVPGYAQVTLTWDAPTSDGGSAILRYEVAVDDSGTWIDAGLDLEETVTGLTNGQRYTFAVRAVNAAGAGLAATVTIVTSHPLPQAWLARFGRAATDHVVDAVSNRWQGGPQASHLTIGGVQTGALFGWIGRVGQAARDTAEDRGDPVRTETSWTRLFAPSGGPGTGGGGTGPGMTVTDRNTGPVGLGGVDRKAGATLSGRAAQSALLGALGLPDPRALTDLRAALLGSSFFYSGAGDEDGQPRTPGRFGEWSAWGRGAASWFSGTDSGLSLDGEVVTAMLGLDSRWDRWRAGVVVSHSRGQGTYAHPTATGGAVASSLTALHPYAGYEFNERTSIWGVLGYGVGEMSLTPERSVTALETGLMNAMAAVGGRMALSVRSGPARRFELAIRSDARLTNTTADGVGAMAGAAGQTHRVRMMLEGSGVMPLASGGVLKPRLEAGLRYDAGDAETGAGLEVGGGLGYAFGRLSLEVNARGLLAHRDTQYEEWGFSGAVAYTPSKDGRGVSLRLGSGWGATQSGVQSLWRRQDATDLVRHAEFDAAQRYQVELRYGLDGLKGRVRWTPYIGVESGGGSSQALRLGVTLTSGRRFDAGLELGRRQGGPGAGPEHAGQIRVTLLW